MSTIHHVQASIEGLLKLSDKKLSDIFEGHGPTIRKILMEQKARGEIYVGSAKCEGFDPITGCPGHPGPDESQECRHEEFTEFQDRKICKHCGHTIYGDFR